MKRLKFLKSNPKKIQHILLWNAINYFLPILIVYIGCQYSTQIFAKLSRWNVKLCGNPILRFNFFKHKVRLFNPVIYLGNLFRCTFGWNLTHQNDLMASIVEKTTMGLKVGTALGFLVFFIVSILRQYANNLGNLHGTANWAKDKNMKKAGLMSNGKGKKRLLDTSGVICGQTVKAKVVTDWSKKSLSLRMKKRGESPLICHEGKANTLLMAQTGHGKGVGVIIPTLLSYKSSIVVYDPKGESWQHPTICVFNFFATFWHILILASCLFARAGKKPALLKSILPKFKICSKFR